MSSAVHERVRIFRRGRTYLLLGAAAILVGLVSWASWPSYCPVELKLIAVESTDFVDESGNMLLLLRLSVHNSSSFGLRFEPGPAVLRSRISDHWVEAPSRWNRFRLAPKQTEEEVFLIAPNAHACRFRLRWAYEPAPYPFGIGSPWARFSPTPMTVRVQKVIRPLSTRLFNALWPTGRPRLRSGAKLESLVGLMIVCCRQRGTIIDSSSWPAFAGGVNHGILGIHGKREWRTRFLGSL